MRRLLHLPIVHSEADIGSLGPALEQGSAALAGARRWALHQETVSRFWVSAAAFLRSLEPHRLKLYQDGLAAGGEISRRIVETAAARGSQNYRLILELLDRGAELRRTEDPDLLLREHHRLLALVRQPAAQPEHRLERDRLLAARDRAIAANIDATLVEGEIGVLFIGADHDVAASLAGDIAVAMLKDPAQVRAYLAALFLGEDDRVLEQLSRDLAATIAAVIS